MSGRWRALTKNCHWWYGLWTSEFCETGWCQSGYLAANAPSVRYTRLHAERRLPCYCYRRLEDLCRRLIERVEEQRVQLERMSGLLAGRGVEWN